jgi:hypothetical protein
MENARYRGLLGEVLDRFIEKGHPGRPALRTGWTWVETVEGWRQALAAAEREPSEPETIDLMVALKESIDAEREPSETKPEGGDRARSLEPGSQPEEQDDDEQHADDCPDDVVHRRHGRMIAHGD